MATTEVVRRGAGFVVMLDGHEVARALGGDEAKGTAEALAPLTGSAKRCAALLATGRYDGDLDLLARAEKRRPQPRSTVLALIAKRRG